MAEIRPFRGVRYNPSAVGSLAEVVAAPYDIITPEAQADYYARSPLNVIRLELTSDQAAGAQTGDRYARAAATYAHWLRDGVLQPDRQPGFYLYEETFTWNGRRRRRRSLFALVRLAGWDERVVLPHEFTLSGPKVDRLNLLVATRAQFSPLLALYDDPGTIASVLSEARPDRSVAEFSLRPGDVAAAAETHRFWQITEPKLIEQLVEAFRPLQLYIADGHHRYETALLYRDRRRQQGADRDAPSEFVLMALVETGDPGLVILPTHRLLRGLGRLDSEAILRRLGERFEIERLPAEEAGTSLERRLAETTTGEALSTPRRPSFLILGLEAAWCHRLTLRSSVDLARELADLPAVLRHLDTVVMQRLLLEPVFGLSDAELERSERIQFTRDPDEARRAFAAGEAQLAVFLDPTPMDQLRAVARAGERMPQKSTYFYPKPVTGLVVYDHVPIAERLTQRMADTP